MNPDASGDHESPLKRVTPKRVSVRTLTGVCHPSNKRAIDWSDRSGLIAYGSHGSVVIVDPITFQVVQTLDDHKSSVTRVAWTKTGCTAKHLADTLTLASADLSGKILIWNVKSGEVKARLHDATGGVPAAVVDMAWLDGRFQNSGHLLLALHSPNALVLWDTGSGVKMWKHTVKPEMAFYGLDLDPFNPNRIVLKSTNNNVFFINDFKPGKPPSGVVRSFQFSSDTKKYKTQQKLQKVRTKVLELVTMSENSATGSSSAPECVQVLFHKTSRNHLLMVFQRQVLIFDLDIEQIVGAIGLDKNSPAIVQAWSCSQRDVLFLLYENGCVSMRVRRKMYNACQTPSMSRSFSQMSVSKTPSGDPESFNFHDQNLFEIVYEQRGLSEPVRLCKNGRILGLAVNEMTEKTMAIFSSEGKLSFAEVLPSNNNPVTTDVPSLCIKDVVPGILDDKLSAGFKLHTYGVLTGLAASPFVVRMCPPLTVKNIEEYVPRLALGAGNGNVQIVDMATGKIEREFAIHTYPVKGIEWTGLYSILSCAHQTSSSSSVVRNELVHTEIRTGATVSLRSHRTEEPPIDMIRVSHLKQYFIVAFTSGPFELWDLHSLNLLRTMPKRFPPITALDWSPLHNLKHLKKKEREKQLEKESSPSEPNEPSPPLSSKLVAKEHFVFTDPEGQLYHFSVEGNSIKDGTKIAAESGLGKPFWPFNAIFAK